jgi:hypothetical protein
MASVWIVELTIECDCMETRDSFMDSLRYVVEEFGDIDIKRENFKIRYTECVKCGIPRKRGTLGSGVSSLDPANKCKPAYWQSCERRQAILEKEHDYNPPF